MIIHLIGNAHLDPVWLWDWREGLNQGLITCRSVLDLMDEFPQLTFNRGEAAVYQHIERTDRETFERIKHYVKMGRWDVVGGTFIQPDENLPATEPFVRQYTRGLTYFASRFGKRVRVAWSADCFGHSAGMPEVLAAAGIQFFLFTRPEQATVPLAKPAFWWIGPGGSRILAYRPTSGWYGTERDEITARLDKTLAEAATADLKNVACLYGLGDHGGGPSRRQIAGIQAWAAEHPEVQVVHSTMHRFFSGLHAEIRKHPGGFLPEHRGELNFCLRGSYSSMARFKFLYRKAESMLCGTERTNAIVSAKLNRDPANLAGAWDHLLFNAFHDILPGTSIERAYEDQISQLNVAIQDADLAQFDAINALALEVDTRVLPVAASSDMPTGVAALVWNPHPRPFDGFVEFEACLDDRQIQKYRDATVNDLPVRILDHQKKPLPFQLVDCENRYAPHIVWRRRAVIPMKLPAMGWSVIEMAWVEGAPPTQPPVEPRLAAFADGEPNDASGLTAIDNGIFRIETRVGQAGVKILRAGKPFLAGDGVGAAVFDDPSGSWGGTADAAAATLRPLLEQWKVSDAVILERGPWRAALWVRLSGQRSRIDLIFHLYAGRDVVEASARVLWNERSARLNLILPADARQTEFEVPGGSVIRDPQGDVPGARWVRVGGEKSAGGSVGFASDALYGFNLCPGQIHATVVRSTRYSDSEELSANQQPWVPATDLGELKFRFLLAPGNERLPLLADVLEQPPTVTLVPSSPGKLPSVGSLLSLEPHNLRLLAFKKSEDGKDWVLRLAETAGQTTRPRLTLMGNTVLLKEVHARQIATYRIEQMPEGFVARTADASEAIES